MASLSEEKMSVIRDRTISKVLWGEHERLTIDFLRDAGLDAKEIDEIMEVAKAEKARVFRKQAVSKLVAYLIGLIVFAAIPWFYWSRPELLNSLRGKAIVCISIFAWTGCLVLFIKTLIEMRSGKNKGAALSE